MKYRIVITELEPNPNYAEQAKEYSRPRMNYGYEQQQALPSMEFEVKSLETVLSQEEFDAVRIACLRAMCPPKDNNAAAHSPAVEGICEWIADEATLKK